MVPVLQSSQSRGGGARSHKHSGDNELPAHALLRSTGTGKTTTALAIGHQRFGPELYKSRVLELNASDDCGSNVVRTKIKDFAAVAVGLPLSSI